MTTRFAMFMIISRVLYCFHGAGFDVLRNGVPFLGVSVGMGIISEGSVI